MDDDFSATLKAWRHRRGWTQRRLAAELGVTGRAVQRWEAGTRKPVDFLRLALERLETLTGDRL